MTNYITVEELSKRLGVSRQTIYTWREKHGLPYVKLVRSVRFDWEQVQEWLKRERG